MPLLIVFQKKVAEVCTFELNVTSCKSPPLCLEEPIAGIISATLEKRLAACQGKVRSNVRRLPSVINQKKKKKNLGS